MTPIRALVTILGGLIGLEDLGVFVGSPVTEFLRSAIRFMVSVVLFVGFFLGFVMPPMYVLFMWRDRWELRLMRLARMSCAQASRETARFWRRRCAVSGEIVGGPSGLLTAPLSGEPCVWFQVWSNGVFNQVTSTPFGVRDTTGTVLVSADMLAAVEAPPLKEIVVEEFGQDQLEG